MSLLLTSSALAPVASPTLAPVEGIIVLVKAGGDMLPSAMAERLIDVPGTDVTFVKVPWRDVFYKLPAEIASGMSNDDVATVGGVWNAASADNVEELSDMIRDDVTADLPPVLPTDTNLAAFNDQCGHDLAPPAPWAQRRNLAKSFTQDGMFGTDVSGMVSEEWTAQMLQAGLPGEFSVAPAMSSSTTPPESKRASPTARHFAN